MTKKEERAYEEGARAASLALLHECLRRLGYGDAEATAVRFVIEREAAIAQLRTLCAEYGDNEWNESLHLADIIEKHLARHLDAIPNVLR